MPCFDQRAKRLKPLAEKHFAFAPLCDHSVLCVEEIFSERDEAGRKHCGGKRAIGGVAGEVSQRIGAKYGGGQTFHFQPHVGSVVFHEMLATPATASSARWCSANRWMRPSC